MQLVVDFLLVHYERAGKGKTILLLHGWGDDARGFASLAKQLQASYDVVRIDLPGFGGSESPPKAWGLSDYAACVRQFCQKLNLEVYAVLGHSNGGAIAIRGLANGSMASQKLILLASAGVRGQYKGRVKVLRLAAKAGKALTYPLPGRLKQHLRKKVYTSIGSDMLVAEHLQETFKRVVQDDVRADAATLTIPTLLIYGSDDKATPPEWGRRLAEKINGSKFVEISGAGHFVHLDALEKCLTEITEFLR